MAIGPLDDEWEYGWNPQTGRTLSDAMASEGVQWDSNGFLASPLSGTFTGGATGLAGATSGINNAIGNVKNALSDNIGSSSWFGKSGILPTAFQGLSALGGLMQAYTGLKGLGLMQDQLENSKNAFRTQFEANRNSLGEQVRNAAATNYAMHRGTDRNFNEGEQRQVADSEANRVKNSYKSYI